jgi:plasmid stability protein
MSKLATEHPEASQLEDAAWDLKSAAEKFHGRAMTAETRAVLASAKRDLERVKRAVDAEWERRCSVRKRGNGTTEEQPEQQELATDG